LVIFRKEDNMEKNGLLNKKPAVRILSALFFGLVLSLPSAAQNRRPVATPNDTLTSVNILPDNRVSFRIYAPKASEVTLGGSDIPNMGQGAAMAKQDNGVWETTLGPIASGAYRYNFTVDGVSVLDPKSASISESNGNVWSLFYLPGAEFMDARDVPHGAVSEVIYFSKSLQRFRRMHVYTPPGYESGKGKFPIFYLLHGAFDCDDSWTTVGRAGFILDNLIAEKKAVPMVVVMPAGHTGAFRFGAGSSLNRAVDEFVLDFVNDIMPFAETHYRVYTDRKHRAMAGLSMGGAQTLNVAIPHLDQFAYIGVFSSGIFGITGGNASGPSWEEQNTQVLDNAKLKDGLALLWFATGADDFLLETSRATVEMLKKHGFAVTFKESTGGHTWINWRDYLNEFAQILFKE
jgi:enterochelin esterase-like enzyme